MTRIRILPTVLLAAVLLLPLSVAAPAQEAPSGLPLPRFVSLRADEVNLRTGPGVRYPIDWVYQRKGLPVQVIAEYEAWRQIRDAEGTTGWVHRTMLSGKRTVAINGDATRLYREPTGSAPVAAWVEPGVIGELLECDGDWCRISATDRGVEGWIERRGLWGVLPDEAGR
jgi:SH3-like domain-containing protein